MKKVFFLSMMLVVSLVSSAFAFDESAWDLEERIYLGEFSLGKPDLTSEMNRGILRLGGLPDGRFVRVSVRTNRAGDVDLNTQLVEKREQTVISALRRIIPVTKLPEANVEVVTGRYDQDGVDAQGAWIEVYKPRQTNTHVPWAKMRPNIITMEDSKQLEHVQADEKIDLNGVIVYVAIVVSSFFLGLLLRKFLVNKQSRINKKRLELIPIVSEREAFKMGNNKYETQDECRIISVQVMLGDQKIVAKTECVNGLFTTFHNGANGVFVTSEIKRWRKSVDNSLRQWLGGDNEYDGSLLLKAINNGQIVRVRC